MPAFGLCKTIYSVSGTRVYTLLRGYREIKEKHEVKKVV